MTNLEYHPLANLFPLIEGKDFDEFCAGIKADGILHDKIVLLEGKILDGRNRYRACMTTGVTAHFETYNANLHGDPLKYVIGKNLHRRHLSDRQRASIAGKLAALAPGRPPTVPEGDEPDAPRPVEETPPIGGVSAEQAGEMLNVAPRQVERARVVHEQGVPELRDALDRGDVPVSIAETVARLPEEEQRREVERRGLLPGGNRSIMASRKEPGDSLDYFPTPPWATRALCQHVLPAAGVAGNRLGVAWEPACGEGHIAAVLDEYADRVIATDVFEYGYGEVQDFLAVDLDPPQVDWLVTNPPFGEHAIEFVGRARSMLRQGRITTGFAMFFRSQWAVEGVERYNEIFRDNPPTLCAFFVERVNLCKGKWDPDGSTATAYCWLVWLKDVAPLPTFWIPPGCRVALSEPDDRERFTASPVARKAPDNCPPDDRQLADNIIGLGDGTSIPDDVGVGVANEEYVDPDTGEVFDSPPTKAALRASLEGSETVEKHTKQQTPTFEANSQHSNEAAENAEAGGPSREDGSADPAPIPVSAASASIETARLWHPSQGEYEGHVEKALVDPGKGTINLITNGKPIHPDLIDDAIRDRSRIWPNVQEWTVTVDGKPPGEPMVPARTKTSANSGGGHHEDVAESAKAETSRESEVGVVPQPSPASDSDDDDMRIPSFLDRSSPDCIVKGEDGA